MILKILGLQRKKVTLLKSLPTPPPKESRLALPLCLTLHVLPRNIPPYLMLRRLANRIPETTPKRRLKKKDGAVRIASMKIVKD